MTFQPSSPGDFRVAIVTGASRGIGRETALRLAQLEYAVVINYVHNQQTAESVVDEILDDRGAAVAIRADVADELDVERLFAGAIEAFGAVDAVVHAVRGHLALSPISEIALHELDTMIRTTARAAFLVNREAARHVRDGGSIINLTGSMSSTAGPAYGPYATATAAIETLVRILAADLRERDITVNALSLDVDRPCAPESVADFISYLLGDPGHGLSGQVVHLEYA